MARKYFADGTGVDYAYDDRRNILMVSDGARDAAFTYNSANRMTGVTYANGRSLQFRYDAMGRRTQTVDHLGFEVNYEYDSLGRLAKLADGANSPIVEYSYDAVGRVASQARGNGTSTLYGYTTTGYVDTIAHRAPDNTVLASFDYDYDLVGRVARMTTLEGVTTYAYDGIGQLTNVALPDGRVLTYTYDAAGNRVAASDNGVVTAYTTNTMNQYTVSGNMAFTYDADGNLLSKTDAGGATVYAYDGEGRLVTVMAQADRYDYEYDAIGNRVAMVHNGERTEYLVDPGGLGDVVAEFDGSGQLVAHYTVGGGLTSRVDANGTSAYYSFDGNGNTAMLTGGTGNVLNGYRYLPFGEPISATGPVANPFTFGGQFGVMNDANGSYFMRNRYYDARQGRFTQQDPIGLAGGLNLYAYAGNNPVSFADPSGLFARPAADSDLDSFGAAELTLDTLNGELLGVSGGSYINFLGAIPDYLQVPRSVFPLAKATLAASVASLILDAAANHDPTYKSQYNFLSQVFSVTNTVLAAKVAVATSTQIATVGGGLLLLGALGTGVGLGTFIDEEVASQHGGFRRMTYDLHDYFFPDNSVKLGDKIKDRVLTPDRLTRVADHRVQQVMSEDPNDIGGPIGFGPERFVSGREPLAYTVLFENQPTATAAAVRVVVTQQVDPDLDWATFEVGDFGFGELHVQVPSGRRSYATRIDIRDTRGEYVDVTAGIDLTTGVATWTFTSIDPETGEMATEVDGGFLLPNLMPPEGDGFANYSILARTELATGTKLAAQASIAFDVNAPIDTRQFVNTIDAVAPASRVLPLPGRSRTTFPVTWEGADDVGGSGIRSFDIYVSDNGGPYQVWLAATTGISALFAGVAGHDYAFLAAATDNVNLAELVPETADAVTRAMARPWNNPVNNFDVSGDGTANVPDLFLLLRRIGSNGSQQLPAPTIDFQPPAFLDVSGDDSLTSFDVVLELRFLRGDGGGEAESDTPSGGPTALDGAAVDFILGTFPQRSLGDGSPWFQGELDDSRRKGKKGLPRN